MAETPSNEARLTFFLLAYWHDPRWRGFVGATVKIWDLAHHLAQLGHHVVLFLPRCGLAGVAAPFDVVEVPFLDAPLLRFISFNIRLAFALLSRGMRRRPDVVYVRRGVSIVPLLYAGLPRASLVFEVNDDPYRPSQEAGVRLISSLRFRLSVKTDECFLRRCHLGIIITREIRERIRARMPGLRAKLLVLPSGANLSVFVPLDRRVCRKALQIDERAECVGFVGSLLSYQGIDVLIEAAPRILEKHPLARFLIIGEGPMKAPWMKEVRHRGLGEAFLFSGQIAYDALPRYLGATDLCVAPFRSAVGFSSPVKIFDYLACGRPVVASLVAGTTDIFAPSGAVRLVPPDNPAALAEAVTEILGDREAAGDMGIKGRAFMEKGFDRLSMARRIAEEAARLRGTGSPLE